MQFFVVFVLFLCLGCTGTLVCASLAGRIDVVVMCVYSMYSVSFCPEGGLGKASVDRKCLYRKSVVDLLLRCDLLFTNEVDSRRNVSDEQ